MQLIVVHQESTHHSLIQSRRVSGQLGQRNWSLSWWQNRRAVQYGDNIVEPVLKKREILVHIDWKYQTQTTSLEETSPKQQERYRYHFWYFAHSLATGLLLLNSNRKASSNCQTLTSRPTCNTRILTSTWSREKREIKQYRSHLSAIRTRVSWDIIRFVYKTKYTSNKKHFQKKW